MRAGPDTTLDSRFSDSDAVATDWDETRRVLDNADLFWISTAERTVDPTSRLSSLSRSTMPSTSPPAVANRDGAFRHEEGVGVDVVFSVTPSNVLAFAKRTFRPDTAPVLIS